MPALRPDVTVVHAQQADRRGNVQLWGISGVQKEAVLAADRALVTVEEVVDELEPRRARCSPGLGRDGGRGGAGGAHPSYAQGYYDRDNAFYVAWDEISRDRDRFLAWMPRAPRGGASRVTESPNGRVHADEMMAVAAARRLRDGAVCFVGIGLPSRAANLARATHAPTLRADLRERHDRREAGDLPLSIGDGELAETADAVVSVPEIFALLAAGRADRRRLPRRGADRPLRQPQQHGDRRLRPAEGAAAGGGGAPEIAAWCRETFVILRQSRARSSSGSTSGRRSATATAPGPASGSASRRGRVRASVTDLGVLEPDPETGELTLTELHPGVTGRRGARGDRLGASRSGRRARDDEPPTGTDELAALRSLRPPRRRGLGGGPREGGGPG